MNSRKSQILLGILLLIFGILILIVKFYRIQYHSILGIMLGVGLIFLYLAKEKSWALILGCIVLMSKGFHIISEIPMINQNFAGGLLLMLPGLALIWLSLKKQTTFYLALGLFLIWTGVYVILTGSPVFLSVAGALFFLLFGLGYLSFYFFGRKRFGKWPIWLGIINLLIGFTLIRGSALFSGISHYLTYALTFSLIGIGLVILIKGIRYK